MSFLGMGPLEILVILILAFVIFGPTRLPGIARSLGKGMQTLRKASMDVTAEFTREMEEAEPKEKDAPEDRAKGADRADGLQKPSGRKGKSSGRA